MQRSPGGGKATRCQAGDGRVSSGKGVRARPLPPAPLRVSRPLSPHPHPTAPLGRGLPPRPPRFPFFCGDHSILSRPGEGGHVCRGPVTSCHSQTLRGLTSPGWPGPSRLSPDAHTPAPRPHSRSRWHACMPSHADSHTPRALTRPPSHTPAGSECGALARPGREQPEDKRPSQDRPRAKGQGPPRRGSRWRRSDVGAPEHPLPPAAAAPALALAPFHRDETSCCLKDTGWEE